MKEKGSQSDKSERETVHADEKEVVQGIDHSLEKGREVRKGEKERSYEREIEKRRVFGRKEERERSCDLFHPQDPKVL